MRVWIKYFNLVFFLRLTRLVEVYDYKDGMTLISELATGGELLDVITSNKYVTEIEVARIIQQVLEGIEYMHSKSIGHLGELFFILQQKITYVAIFNTVKKLFCGFFFASETSEKILNLTF